MNAVCAALACSTVLHAAQPEHSRPWTVLTRQCFLWLQLCQLSKTKGWLCSVTRLLALDHFCILVDRVLALLLIT